MTLNEMLQLVPEEDRDKDMEFLDIYTGQRSSIGVEGVRDSCILITTDKNQHFCKECIHLQRSNATA